MDRRSVAQTFDASSTGSNSAFPHGGRIDILDDDQKQ